MLVSLGLLAILSGLVAGATKDCQYFFDTDLAYPIGIDRCSYIIRGSERSQTYSFLYHCDSTSQVTKRTYNDSFYCEGPYTNSTYNHSNSDFRCDTDFFNCGKLFGGKSPCTCNVDDGDCDYAVEISLVDQLCFNVTTGVEKTAQSYMWDITCGRYTKPNAALTNYTTGDCTGSSETATYQEGCHDHSGYVYNNNTLWVYNEVDVIVCPGNMASFSLALIAALIFSAFAL